MRCRGEVLEHELGGIVLKQIIMVYRLWQKIDYWIELTTNEVAQTEIGKSVLIVGPLSPGKVVLKEEACGIP